MFTQPPQIPRSPFASTLTLVFHVCLGLVVIAISAVPNIPKIVDHERLTFVVAAAPPPNFEFSPPPPPKSPPVRIDPPVVTPPQAFDVPAVVKPPAPPAPQPEARPEPPPPVPAPPPPTPPSAMPPKPAVVVGGFADAQPARRPDVKLDLTPTGFDNAAAQTSRTRREVAAVGGFDNAPASAGTTRAVQVSDAGFGADASASSKRTALVAQPTDFSAAPAATKQAQAPRAKADQAVEVLFKPTPAYTDEARTQRVEGNVVLEVEFAADGQVRVLRVVKGLGFGLDEMARRATEQIRFKPATSAGVPVDFRAQLTVVFRLT